MRQLYFFLSFVVLAFLAKGQVVSISPFPFEVDQQITITLNYNNTTDTDCNGFNNPPKIYMHAGIGDDANPWGFSVVGNWGQDDGVGQMVTVAPGTAALTITPSTHFNLNATQIANATKMGMVFRNAAGNEEIKATGCSDFIFNVGALQITRTAPMNDVTIINSGENVTVTATSTLNATFELKQDGTTIHTTSAASTNFNHTVNNVTNSSQFELIATDGSNTISNNFQVVVNPGAASEALPAGLQPGLNISADATKATMVLEAPGKQFVYLLGNFNNFSPQTTYAMKKDPTTGFFWLEVSGLTPGNTYMYQYLVDGLIRIGDPYSELIINPWDDPFIDATRYPNMPAYPTGQTNFDVSVFKAGQQTVDYAWSIPNFTKPANDDLLVYEVLIRDFTVERTYQSLIDRMSYFTNLNINTIHLMPVMEFDGNESWGYNPSHHGAVDKYYGPPEKLKEFIDVCHQNGIAVILDIALNHATGRSPLVRMWMNDPDGDGFGTPAANSPYFNQTATHSYSVFEDFNQSQTITQNYVKRIIQNWIENFNIDGFRWDLTKGFTQNCTGSDACTNSYQQDRVDIMKMYADYQWEVDPTSIVIFEHLGNDDEESVWANYRNNEGKQIMMWGKMTDQYNQNTMGYATGSNFNRMGAKYRAGFNSNGIIGYPESHDEERINYKNMAFGTTGVNNNLTNSLTRMSALGAVSLMVPGPKMIWQFGELGWDHTLFGCFDATGNMTSMGEDCKLSNKPSAFMLGWDTVPARQAVYQDWAKMMDIKTTEPVFETFSNYTIEGGDLKPRIYIWNDALPSTELKNVVILANFLTTTQNIIPSFPYTGTWYELMEETTLNVTDVNAPISLQPGEFRIYGNQLANLSTENNSIKASGLTLEIENNPVRGEKAVFHYTEAINAELQVYDANGRLLSTQPVEDGNHQVELFFKNPSGIYIVAIKSENGQVIEKVIKQ